MLGQILAGAGAAGPDGAGRRGEPLSLPRLRPSPRTSPGRRSMSTAGRRWSDGRARRQARARHRRAQAASAGRSRRRFAAEGARVAIVDRAPKETSDEVVAAIEANGGKAFAAQADISDEAQVLKLFKTALKKLGGLDILVNNAGILLEKPLLETTRRGLRPADRREPARRVPGRARGAPRDVARRDPGASSTSPRSLPISAARTAPLYCASKGGVLSMTRSWAREFAPHILVNAIAPGPTDTPMLGPESTSPETLAKESHEPARPDRAGRKRSRRRRCSWPGPARHS